MEGIICTTETVSFAARDTNRLPAIDGPILGQFHELVSRVAALYREYRPFHSFEHPRHVILSVTKFFAAIYISNNNKIDDDLIRAQLSSLEVLTKTKSMLAHPVTHLFCVGLFSSCSRYLCQGQG